VSDSAIVITGYLVAVGLGLAIWLLTHFEVLKLTKVGDLMERILHHRTTRLAIILAWWWIGWHFLVNEVTR
jgi:type IV secretory pathway TrbD component